MTYPRISIRYVLEHVPCVLIFLSYFAFQENFSGWSSSLLTCSSTISILLFKLSIEFLFQKIKILTSKSLVDYYGYNILYPLCLSNDFFAFLMILIILILISYSFCFKLAEVPDVSSFTCWVWYSPIVLASLKYLMNLGVSSYLYFWFPLAYRWKPASKCCWRGMEYMLGSVSQSLNS